MFSASDLKHKTLTKVKGDLYFLKPAHGAFLCCFIHLRHRSIQTTVLCAARTVLLYTMNEVWWVCRQTGGLAQRRSPLLHLITPQEQTYHD